MKFNVSGFLAVSALTGTLALGVAGCSQNYHSNANAPQVSLQADHHSVQVGETVWVHATTLNLTNSKLKWKVSPSTGMIKPDNAQGDQEAQFSASQPGGYMIKASAKTSDGQWVTGRTSISVISQGNQ